MVKKYTPVQDQHHKRRLVCDIFFSDSQMAQTNRINVEYAGYTVNEYNFQLLGRKNVDLETIFFFLFLYIELSVIFQQKSGWKSSHFILQK